MPDLSRSRHSRFGAAAAAIMVGTLLALPASADPIADERARAVAIAEEREAIIEEAERLNQRQQAALDELGRLDTEERQLNTEVAGRDAGVTSLREQAAEILVNTYVHGSGASSVGAVLADGGTGPRREAYTTSLYGNANDAIDRARAARDDLQRAIEKLRDVIAVRKTVAEALERDQAALAAKEQQLAELAERTDANIATLVAEEQARIQREAEERAAAEAQRRAQAIRFTPPAVVVTVADQPATTAPRRAGTATTVASTTATTKPKSTTTKATATTVKKTTTSSPRATTPGATTAPPVTETEPDAPETTPAPVTTRAPSPATTQAPAPKAPAPSPGAAIAVAEARRQLGKPYRFGATGPDAFDCSGLTKWAWAKAGVSMAHYTGSQYSAFPKVAFADLQPGDLVFFRADLGHMGMYIGGGQMIHAPRTGEVVSIASISGRSFVGAVRPG